jgi:hypothetical protein
VAPVARRALPVLLAAVCALVAARAGAATSLPRPGSSAIWATVDRCDARTETVGVRGAMPGTGDARQRMYMGFQLEYRSPHGRWVALPGRSSGLQAVGSGAARERQAGQIFSLGVLGTGTGSYPFVLRGVVSFQWRLHGRVVASAVRSTTAGHHPGAGASPPGYSASSCRLVLKRRGSLVITPVTPSASRRASSRASLTVHT